MSRAGMLRCGLAAVLFGFSVRLVVHRPGRRPEHRPSPARPRANARRPLSEMAERSDPIVVVRSSLAIEPGRLWNQIVTLDGVNLEMAPWLALRSRDDVDLRDGRAGQVLALQLFGPGRVPLGPYLLRFTTFDDGRRFVEETKSPLFALWTHERNLEPTPSGGTLITDSLSWTRTSRLLNRPLTAGVRRFFEHRHRVLRRMFDPFEPGESEESRRR